MIKKPTFSQQDKRYAIHKQTQFDDAAGEQQLRQKIDDVMDHGRPNKVEEIEQFIDSMRPGHIDPSSQDSIVKAPVEQEPDPVLDQGAPEQERPVEQLSAEEVTEKMQSVGDLEKDNSSASIVRNSEALPEADKVLNHLKDVEALVKARADNPNFATDIGMKMLETDKAINHLGRKISDIKTKGQKPPNPKPVDDALEMIVRLIEMIFGRKTNMTKQDQVNLPLFQQDMERMKERMDVIDSGLKTYQREHHLRKEMEQDHGLAPELK